MNYAKKLGHILYIIGFILTLQEPLYCQWTDITSSIGGGISSTTNMGRAIVFDANNDQYPDFMVPVLTSVTSPYTKYWKFFKNNGNSTYSELTSSYGLPLTLSASSYIGFIDQNGDGYKDLFSYNSTGFKIFRNNNGVSFTDVSSQLGITTLFFTSGEVSGSMRVFDYDLDGDEDILYTRTVSSVNTLTAIVNNGSSFSTKVNIISSIPGATSGGISFAFFDMDNDNDFDIVFDAYNTSSHYSNGIISLFRKDSGGFTNATAASGLVNGLPNEPIILDINQDGNLDIIKGGSDCCSSPLYRVYTGSGNGTFTDQTNQYAINNGVYKNHPVLIDFDNDADFDFSWTGFTSTGAAPFRLYSNNNNVFTENAATYGLNLGVTSGGVPIDDVANGIWLDIEKDGDLDILLNREGWGSTSTTGNVWIKRNPIQGNYIDIKLNGCNVNKSGIGSRIKLQIGSVTRWAYYGNSPDGNFSNGTDIFHFGLGTATLINSITVYWPNNTTTVLNNVNANQFLTINGGPDQTVTPNGPTTFCQGSSVSLINNYIPGYTYQWQNNGVDILGANSNTFIASESGSYSLIVSNSAGCISETIPVIVTELPLPTVNAGADIAICKGSNVTLYATGASIYTWSDGIQNGVPFSPQNAGTYTVTGTTSNGCTGTDQINLSLHPAPQVYAGPDQQICIGGQVTLSGSGASTYSWSGGISDGVPFTPQISAGYVLTGINDQGCSNYDTVIVQLVNSFTVTDNIFSCSNYTWIDGNNYTSSNSTASFLTSSVYGCDSLILLDLYIPSQDTNHIQSTALESYTLNGATYTQTGTYFQNFQDINGCDSIIALELFIEQASIDEGYVEFISIHPNPSETGLFYFDSSNTFTIVEICDSYGRKVNFRNDGNSLDISNLEKGCYFIHFKTEFSVFIKKIIYK